MMGCGDGSAGESMKHLVLRSKLLAGQQRPLGHALIPTDARIATQAIKLQQTNAGADNIPKTVKKILKINPTTKSEALGALNTEVNKINDALPKIKYIPNKETGAKKTVRSLTTQDITYPEILIWMCFLDLLKDDGSSILSRVLDEGAYKRFKETFESDDDSFTFLKDYGFSADKKGVETLKDLQEMYTKNVAKDTGTQPPSSSDTADPAAPEPSATTGAAPEPPESTASEPPELTASEPPAATAPEPPAAASNPEKTPVQKAKDELVVAQKHAIEGSNVMHTIATLIDTLPPENEAEQEILIKAMKDALDKYNFLRYTKTKEKLDKLQRPKERVLAILEEDGTAIDKKITEANYPDQYTRAKKDYRDAQRVVIRKLYTKQKEYTNANQTFKEKYNEMQNLKRDAEKSVKLEDELIDSAYANTVKKALKDPNTTTTQKEALNQILEPVNEKIKEAEKRRADGVLAVANVEHKIQDTENPFSLWNKNMYENKGTWTSTYMVDDEYDPIWTNIKDNDKVTSFDYNNALETLKTKQFFFQYKPNLPFACVKQNTLTKVNEYFKDKNEAQKGLNLWASTMFGETTDALSVERKKYETYVKKLFTIYTSDSDVVLTNSIKLGHREKVMLIYASNPNLIPTEDREKIKFEKITMDKYKQKVKDQKINFCFTLYDILSTLVYQGLASSINEIENYTNDPLERQSQIKFEKPLYQLSLGESILLYVASTELDLYNIQKKMDEAIELHDQTQENASVVEPSGEESEVNEFETFLDSDLDESESDFDLDEFELEEDFKNDADYIDNNGINNAEPEFLGYSTGEESTAELSSKMDERPWKNTQMIEGHRLMDYEAESVLAFALEANLLDNFANDIKTTITKSLSADQLTIIQKELTRRLLPPDVVTKEADSLNKLVQPMILKETMQTEAAQVNDADLTAYFDEAQTPVKPSVQTPPQETGTPLSGYLNNNYTIEEFKAAVTQLEDNMLNRMITSEVTENERAKLTAARTLKEALTTFEKEFQSKIVCPPAPVPAPVPAGESAKTATAELKKLSAQIQDDQGIIQKLQDDLEACEKDKSTHEKQHQETLESCNADREKLNEVQNELTTQTAAKKKLEDQVKESTAKNQKLLSSVEKLNKELKQNQTQIETFKTQLATAKTERDTIKKQLSQIQSGNADVDTLKNELTDAQDLIQQAHNLEIETLTAQLDSDREQAKRLEEKHAKAIDALKSEFETERNRLTATTAEQQQELTSRLESSEKEVKDLQDTIKSLEEKTSKTIETLEATTLELGAKEKKVADLNTQLQTKLAKITELTQSETELQTSIATLTTDAKTFKQRADRALDGHVLLRVDLAYDLGGVRRVYSVVSVQSRGALDSVVKAHKEKQHPMYLELSSDVRLVQPRLTQEEVEFETHLAYERIIGPGKLILCGR